MDAFFSTAQRDTSTPIPGDPWFSPTKKRLSLYFTGYIGQMGTQYDGFGHQGRVVRMADGTLKNVYYNGFTQDELFDVFHVLMDKGGYCDCEILYNAAEESRLKAEYWRARAAELEPYDPHGGTVAET